MRVARSLWIFLAIMILSSIGMDRLHACADFDKAKKAREDAIDADIGTQQNSWKSFQSKCASPDVSDICLVDDFGVSVIDSSNKNAPLYDHTADKTPPKPNNNEPPRHPVCGAIKCYDTVEATAICSALGFYPIAGCLATAQALGILEKEDWSKQCTSFCNSYWDAITAILADKDALQGILDTEFQLCASECEKTTKEGTVQRQECDCTASGKVWQYGGCDFKECTNKTGDDLKACNCKVGGGTWTGKFCKKGVGTTDNTNPPANDNQTSQPSTSSMDSNNNTAGNTGALPTSGLEGRSGTISSNPSANSGLSWYDSLKQALGIKGGGSHFSGSDTKNSSGKVSNTPEKKKKDATISDSDSDIFRIITETYNGQTVLYGGADQSPTKNVNGPQRKLGSQPVIYKNN